MRTINIPLLLSYWIIMKQLDLILLQKKTNVHSIYNLQFTNVLEVE